MKIQYIRTRLDFYMVVFMDINNYTDLQITTHTPFIESLN